MNTTDAFKYVVENLEVINVKPTDCFMLKIVNDEIDLDTVNSLVQDISEKYPHNTVIAVPDGAMLEIVGVEYAKKWLRTALNFLEEMENYNGDSSSTREEN